MGSVDIFHMPWISYTKKLLFLESLISVCNSYIYVILRCFKTSVVAFRLSYSIAFNCSIRPFLDLFRSWLYTWVVWKVLGLDHGWQLCRQGFFLLSWYICHKHPCEICKSFYQVVCFIQLSEAGVLSVSLKMDKIEYRAVLKLFVKEGLTPNEIHSYIPSFQVLRGRPRFFSPFLQVSSESSFIR